MASHVVATDARSIPASVVSAAAATYGLDPDVVVVLTRVAADGELGEPAGSVAKLVSLASTSAFHTPSVLGKMQEAVMPGGEIVVGVLGDTSSNVAPAPEGDLLVAGFTDAKAAGGVVPGVAPGALAASKPTWTAGASFSLKSRKLKENAAPLNALNGDGNAAKAWKLGARRRRHPRRGRLTGRNRPSIGRRRSREGSRRGRRVRPQGVQELQLRAGRGGG